MDDDGFYMAELRGQRGLVPRYEDDFTQCPLAINSKYFCSNFLTEAPGQYTGPGMGPGGLVTRGGAGVMMPGMGAQMQPGVRSSE